MNIAKLKAFGLSCAYFLFVVFSVSANASGQAYAEPGPLIEGWSSAGGQILPILDFEGAQLPEDILSDIQVENVTVEEDGSTRFQLTHSGPMSRQTFAHVRRVEQDDGFTRSIITNIADGQQMEYLTESSRDPLRGNFSKEKANEMLTQAALGGDQEVECPWCVYISLVISEAVCAATISMAYDQCRESCWYLGGVSYFNSGICGMYNSECKCMVDPNRINEEFGETLN